MECMKRKCVWSVKWQTCVNVYDANQLTRMAFDFRTKSEGRPGGIRTHVYVFSARVIALARIKNVDIKGKVSKDWGY